MALSRQSRRRRGAIVQRTGVARAVADMRTCCVHAAPRSKRTPASWLWSMHGRWTRCAVEACACSRRGPAEACCVASMAVLRLSGVLLRCGMRDEYAVVATASVASRQVSRFGGCAIGGEQNRGELDHRAGLTILRSKYLKFEHSAAVGARQSSRNLPFLFSQRPQWCACESSFTTS